MPKIYTLAKDTEISGSDKLLGTDSTIGANNATKNYVIDDLKTYILASAGGVADGDKGDITVSSTGNVWTIDDGVVSDSKIASGIDAIKIGGGAVSNTEFGYLDGVTSAIQTQLNARTVSGTAGLIQFSDGSAFASDSNLHWDNTNKRLGVGTITPNASLEIVDDNQNQTILGVKTSQSTNTFRIYNTNTAATPVWQIGSSSPDTRISMYNTMSFRANGTTIGNLTSTEFQLGGASGARLSVKGSGSTSATTALLVQNSSSAELLKVTDDGTLTRGNIQIESGFRIKNLSSTSTLSIANNNASAYINVFGSGHATQPQSSIACGVLSGFKIDSTTSGFLPPRMTTTDKSLIPVPAAGLQVYDNTLNRMSIHTTTWENIVTEEPNSPNAVANIWVGTQAQYNALIANSSTLYIII